MKFFDIQNRIGNDTCSSTADNKFNKDINDYMLFNSYKTNQSTESDSCVPSIEKLQEFVTDNYMHIRDGVGFTSGCKVDTDSDMRMYNITNGKSRCQLQSRVFQAVPNLSKGESRPELESKLVQGENSYNSTQCQGQTLDVFMPMLPCLKNSIQNPSNIIQDWSRGGESTRDTLKQKEFLDKNGYLYDGKEWSKRQM
jgi:hypothetical protein